MQQYTYIDVIFLGPLFSFIGSVISIITRKTRKIHPALWISGIISCMLGFIVCMFVFSMLIGGLICGLYMDWSKRQTMRQSLKSTPPIIGDVASCIRPEDYLTMA